MTTTTKIFVILVCIFSFILTPLVIAYAAQKENWRKLANDTRAELNIAYASQQSALAILNAEEARYAALQKRDLDRYLDLQQQYARLQTELGDLSRERDELKRSRDAWTTSASLLTAEMAVKTAHNKELTDAKEAALSGERELQTRNLQLVDRVKELDAQKGIVWLNPSQANNTYGLAMRAADAGEKGIASISDLAAAVNDGQSLTFGSNAEFYARPDGLKPLETAYGFEFGRANVKRMDTGLVYQALRDGQVDVGLVFATDGRIPAFDFTVLEDDQGYFPSYALAPVIRTEVLEANPGIGDLLNEVSAKLDDQVMAALNASVDVDKVSVENAAAKFLQDNGLI